MIGRCVSWLLLSLVWGCGPSIAPPARPAPSLPPPPDVAPGSTAKAPEAPELPAGPNPIADLLADDVGPAPLKVHMIDIGQGDSLLIETPAGKRVLIDSGPTRGKRNLLKFLAEKRVDRIDMAVNTHAHSDHIGNLDKVIESRAVGMVLSSGVPHTTKMFKTMLDAIERKQVPLKIARRGRTITLEEGVTLEVLGPEEPLIVGSRSDMNANSVVLRLDYGDIRVLFTGDAEEETEQRLLAHEGDSLRATVLKVAHHGSRHASHTPFLKAVAPRLAIISASKSNRYGHPAPETMAGLSRAGVVVYDTPTHGHISLLTDGKKLKIVTQKRAPAHLPRPPGEEEPPAVAAPAVDPSTLVDVNTADAAALDALPGIGKSTAKRIIDYRNANGPFRSVAEMQKVKGIGKKTVKKLEKLVRIVPPKS